MSEIPLIDFQRVTYTYRQVGTEERVEPALEDLQLQVRAGEYLAVLGHNGSGKSTLARHCNALLTPDSGRVLVTGMDTREQGYQKRIRETVGMIFQQPDNQIIATIVEDDVAWGLAVRGFPAQEIAERVTASLEAVGLAHLRKQSPQRLSGGQRQRLAIASVLALRPRCIIADEATSQLDPLSRQEIVRLLHSLHRAYGLTIIHVTHLLEEVMEAERILVMEQGHILMEGRPEEIFADLERLRALKLVVPESLELAALLRAAGLPLAPGTLSAQAIAREVAS
ncbi:MAG TPA: energy-coupling factor transporter ATPase [Ktedonobacteraceae bacterium]